MSNEQILRKIEQLASQIKRLEREIQRQQDLKDIIKPLTTAPITGRMWLGWYMAAHHNQLAYKEQLIEAKAQLRALKHKHIYEVKS